MASRSGSFAFKNFVKNTVIIYTPLSLTKYEAHELIRETIDKAVKNAKKEYVMKNVDKRFDMNYVKVQSRNQIKIVCRFYDDRIYNLFRHKGDQMAV